MPRPTNQAVADRIISLVRASDPIVYRLGRRLELKISGDGSWLLNTVYNSSGSVHCLLLGYHSDMPCTATLPRNALRSAGWTAENIRHCEIAVLVYRGLGGQLALRVPRRSQRTLAQRRADPSRPGGVARVAGTVEPWVYAPDLLVDDGGISLPDQVAAPVSERSIGGRPNYRAPLFVGEPPRPSPSRFNDHDSYNVDADCGLCREVATWRAWAGTA